MRRIPVKDPGDTSEGTGELLSGRTKVNHEDPDQEENVTSDKISRS